MPGLAALGQFLLTWPARASFDLAVQKDTLQPVQDQAAITQGVDPSALVADHGGIVLKAPRSSRTAGMHMPS